MKMLKNLSVIGIFFTVTVFCLQAAVPPMPDFYAHASTEFLSKVLPPFASLGNPARDAKNPDGHFSWANGRNPQVVKNELIAKFDRMTEIKKKQGQERFARWYARICTEWAGYGVNFGSPAANSHDFNIHYSWAMGQGMKPVVLRDQLVMRINKIFSFYTMAPKPQPKPWPKPQPKPQPKPWPKPQPGKYYHKMVDFYVLASHELLALRLPPFTTLGSPGRDSKDKNSHFKWANGNNPQILKNELISKFNRMVDIKASKGKERLARWYAQVCSEMASLKINFGSPAANSLNHDVHYNWAMGPNMRPEVLRQQIEMRVRKVFQAFGF